MIVIGKVSPIYELCSLEMLIFFKQLFIKRGKKKLSTSYRQTKPTGVPTRHARLTKLTRPERKARQKKHPGGGLTLPDP